MNAIEHIRHAVMTYTSIFPNPQKAIYHMMFVNGNGYGWNSNGELVTWEENKDEYKYSKFPLSAAKEKFVHDNIDLLMQDLTGIQ